MINFSLKQLAIITYGILHQINDEQASKIRLTKISINSRQKNIAGSLFIALQGKYFDGHNFITDAIKSGVKALLVNYPLSITYPQVIVKDTYLAMGQLASWIRKKSNAKVIGITGSAGKTSVKEMVASILNINNNTLFTKDNLNNKIGVCLTLFRLTSKHKYIVIEIGASQMNEIRYITNIIQPDSVLINNLYISHLEGFGSLNGIAKAKSEIFYGLKQHATIVLNLESNRLRQWKKYFLSKQKIWFFSIKKKQNSNFYAKNIILNTKNTKFVLYTPIGTTQIMMPLIGEHNIANAIAASALSISVGINLENIKTGLINMTPIIGRLYPINIAPGKIIMDDTYNSNIGSMIASINVLKKMPGYRIFVLSDMEELGKNSKFYHYQIGHIIKKMNFHMILTIGENSILFSKYSKFNQHFTSKHTLISKLIKLIKINKIVSVLIKGSHSRKMQDIIYAIKEYFYVNLAN